MEPIVHYRTVVQRILQEYASYYPAEEGMRVEVVFDENADHYEVLLVGWQGWNRIHQIFLHVDIRGGKVWLEHDGTEEGIAPEMVASGIPQEHIVLAFLHPFERQMMPFALA